MSKRLFLSTLTVASAVLLSGENAAAQAQQPLPATTVQLPTFSFFTVNTTVSVPDRGGAYLGGINRARDGRIERGFGPLANKAIGGDRLASGASVHATIIDHAEIDRELLAAAAARRSGTTIDPADAKAAALSKHVGVGGVPAVAAASATAPAASVAAIKAQNAAAAEERTSEAAQMFAKARQAEADGKLASAKIFYQMVVRRDAGPLKQQAQARLAALSKPALAAQ